MCGIFSVCMKSQKAKKLCIAKIILDGLVALQPRGYDSTGLLLQNSDGDHYLHKSTESPNVFKEELLKELELDELRKNRICFFENGVIIPNDSISSQEESIVLGMGHNRWSTTGPRSLENCHPHEANNEFFVVQNGIFEKYKEHRNFLINKGYNFTSETDTEIACQYAKYFYDISLVEDQKLIFENIIDKVISKLKGNYAAVFTSKHFPGEMIGVKKGNSLILGIKTEKISQNFINLDEETEEFDKIYISSETSAFAGKLEKIVYLEDGDVIVIRNNRIVIKNQFSENKNKTRQIEDFRMSSDEVSLGDFNHFMEKEIKEQYIFTKNSFENRVNFDKSEVILNELTDEHLKKIRSARRLIFFACGTSFNACATIRALYEKLLDMPIEIEICSDFLDRKPKISKDDVAFFISQSGQTQDTIKVLEYCKQHEATCFGISNKEKSTLEKKADATILIRAGTENGVAATKSFTSQYVVLVLLALKICDSKEPEIIDLKKEIIKDLGKIPGQIYNTLLRSDTMYKTYKDAFSLPSSLYIIGRNTQFGIAKEGALKISEIAYTNSTGIFGGELKHGSLALIDDKCCVIQIIMDDSVFDKSNISFDEIMSKGGKPLVICNEEIEEKYKNKVFTISIPKTNEYLQGLLSVIPFQIFAYRSGLDLGNNVDCPRNLSKTITTE